MRKLCLATALAIVAVSPAAAHEPVPGVAGVVSGLPHVLTEPSQILLVLALALWLGQSSDPRRGAALLVLSSGLLVGTAAGLLSGLDIVTLTPAALAIACLLGLASGLRLAAPSLVSFTLALPIAVFAGLFCVPDPGPLPAMLASGSGALAGAAAFATLVLLAARWCADPERPAPLGIALRVAGSWIAAASLMAGALAFARL